jgi:hypothetical protein
MPGAESPLNSEWHVLLAASSATPRPEKLARLRILLQQPIQWKSLYELAERHGVQPLLYQALQSVADAVPAEAMNRLKRSNDANLHKTLLLSRELIRIVEHLSTLGLEVIPYKGLALAETLYGDISMRPSGDIDLLIHAQDLPRIREAVCELGYTPHAPLSESEERAYLKSGYECAFDGEAGPNLLEVQWAIQPRFYAVDFDMTGLFDRAVTITVAGRTMKTPSYADLLLVLSVHAAKHMWGRLIWLCDIERLLQLPGLDWVWIGSQARGLGIARILRITMLAANRMLGIAVPQAAETNLPQDPSGSALANEVLAHIAGEQTYNVESLSYFRMMMRLRERTTDRIRFLQRLVLTPGPGEWEAVRLPHSLSPLYRLVRLSRLAARLVSQ